ncbi:MAG: hypothetical protein CMJ64_05045 [Planctomycetaceae bacterium]|nr:hypothetical protein [Planctomycetaceae bacterium]
MPLVTNICSGTSGWRLRRAVWIRSREHRAADHHTTQSAYGVRAIELRLPGSSVCFRPSLRERERDITVLAHHFANQFEREVPAFRGKRFSKAAIAELNRYSFPGNIRELKKVIERAVYRETHDEITPGDLGLASPDALLNRSGSFRDKVNAFSRELLADAVKQSNGNQAEAAWRLGLSYHQFRYYYGKFLKADSTP